MDCTLRRNYLGKFRGFADKFPKGPRIKHVNWSGERDREEENKQVAQCQIEDKYVGQVAHGFVTTYDEDEIAVAVYVLLTYKYKSFDKLLNIKITWYLHEE